MKRTGKKLTLTKETLHDLTKSDLNRAAGGAKFTAVVNGECQMSNTHCQSECPSQCATCIITCPNSCIDTCGCPPLGTLGPR